MDNPVMYLDVDGVLWLPTNQGYAGPMGLTEFMEFALANYEVRWCTAWATSGDMRTESLQRLRDMTGVPLDVWRQVQPSLGWERNKTETIDWAEVDAGRPFVWIDDELYGEDLELLRRRGIEHWCILTNVLENPCALSKTLRELKSRVEAQRGTA